MRQAVRCAVLSILSHEAELDARDELGVSRPLEGYFKCNVVTLTRLIGYHCSAQTIIWTSL